MSVDISTTYLGLRLTSPLVASCSPLTGQIDSLLALQDSGAGAVVLPSLFEEEVEAEEMAAEDLLAIGEDQAEFAFSPLAPEIDLDAIGSERALQLVRDAKVALDIPVIASVNGYRPGGWAKYAKLLAEAGADAIELNLYSVNTDPDQSADQVEESYLKVISDVAGSVDVPVSVKLSQYFSALANFVRSARQVGASGVVLFNRFYGAEIDLDEMEIIAKRRLSSSDELRFPLRWIGILREQNPGLSLAATSGIHSGQDVLKALAAGADVACTTAAVLVDGPAKVTDLLAEVETWLARRGYKSTDELRGAMSAGNAPNPGAYERAQYMDVIRARP